MASRSLGTLTLDLVARIGGFTGPLDKAARDSKKYAKSIEDGWRTVGTAVGAAAGAAAIGLGYMVKQSINAADEARKASQAVGLTTESYTGLQFAASQSGVATDQLNAAMSRLNATVGQAAIGSKEQVAVFRALGVEIKDASGSVRDGDAIFKDLADRFAAMPDGVDKSAAAIKIFGRAGAALIPLLNSGAEGIDALTTQAEKLGLVIGEETARKAEQFNDNLAVLGSVAKGSANIITAELVPALADITDELVNFVVDTEAAKGIGESLGVVLKGMAYSVVTLAEGFTLLGKKIGGWAAIMAAVASGDFKGAKAIFDIADADIEEVEAKYDRLKAKILDAGEAVTGPKTNGAASFLKNLGEDAEATAGKVKTATDKQREAVEETIRALEQQVITLGFSDDALKVHELWLNGATASEAEYAQSLLATIRAYNEVRKAAEEYEGVLRDMESGKLALDTAQFPEFFDDGRVKERKDYEDVAESLKTEEEKILESYQRRREIILSNTEETGEARQELLRRLDEQFIADTSKLSDELTKNLDPMVALWEDAFNKMKDATAELFVDVLEGNIDSFDDFADAFGKTLNRIVAEWLAAQATMAAKNLLSGIAGMGLGMIGSMFGGGAGAGVTTMATQSSPVGVGANFLSPLPRAVGGEVWPNQPFLVGEKGPELLVPQGAASIVPTSKIGGNNVSFSFNVGDDNRHLISQLESRVSRVVHEVLRSAS